MCGGEGEGGGGGVGVGGTRDYIRMNEWCVFAVLEKPVSSKALNPHTPYCQRRIWGGGQRGAALLYFVSYYFINLNIFKVESILRTTNKKV